MSKLDEQLVAQYIRDLRALNLSRFNGDYLRTADYTSDELQGLLLTVRVLEALQASNVSCRAFDTGLAVANFRDKSTRTRFAFASACSLLGLQCEQFDESTSQVGHGETVRETAAMLSFLTEVIGIRDDLYIEEGSKYMRDTAASVQESFDAGVLPQRPTVVNLQCDEDHPTQSMSDLLHLIEHCGGGDVAALKGKTIAVSWAYSPSYGKPLSVPQGLITLLTRFGMNVRLAHPEGYDLLPHTLDTAARFARESGGTFTTHTSMKEAFAGADVVYPKSWAPYTVMVQRRDLLRGVGPQGKLSKDALAAAMSELETTCIANNDRFRDDWTCTEEMMTLTRTVTKPEEAMYMHCLPADITDVSCAHGEVAASVFERHRLNTYREASHKPYVIAAAIILNRFKQPADVLARMMHRGMLRRDERRSTADDATTTTTTTTTAAAAAAATDNAVPAFVPVTQQPCDEVTRFASQTYPTGLPTTTLDDRTTALAEQYTELANTLLREAIRIPADHVDSDPNCGMSGGEEPRLQYLKRMLVEHKCVAKPEDAWFDEFGALVWTVTDQDEPDVDATTGRRKRVVYFDGHTDTVAPLRDEWQHKIGAGGIDVYDGVCDADKANIEYLRSELGYVPEKSEWSHLIFGRGSADQLSGVVQQMIATKIMLELREYGSMRGVVVRSYATVSEEDNDGGVPMYVMREVVSKQPELAPDVVLHTEGTGDVRASACGIYTGQRGRMQIEVEVIGRSSHGSMPWMGANPLEYGAAIITEHRLQFDNTNSKDADGNNIVGYDSFLGQGTRTASWCRVDTPSDCAVPARFVFRLDRRLTVGEEPDACLAAVEQLPSVAAARAAGCTVNVRVPHYGTPTWRGYHPNNAQLYPGWQTPASHPAVHAAVETWRRTVTHGLLKDVSDADDAERSKDATLVPKHPRLGRWIFSTDGVGYPVLRPGTATAVKAAAAAVATADTNTVVARPPTVLGVPAHKRWIRAGDYHHPAQLGMGIGYEQNTHKIGEFIDARHFPAAIAFVARFPSMYAVHTDANVENDEL